MNHGELKAKVDALSDHLDKLAYNLKGTKYDLNNEKTAPDFKAVGDQIDASIKAVTSLVEKAHPAPEPVPATK